MAQDQVEEIKRKTDIVELISEYVDLKHSGRNFKALCPFHSEKTPSFMVSPEIGIFKCFGCFPAGQLVKTPRGFHPIEQIVEEDEVISGKGNRRKVLSTHARAYEGNLVTVWLWKLGSPITLTEDHNVFIVGGAPYTREYKNLARRLNSYKKYSKKEALRRLHKYFPIEKVKAGKLQKGICLLYPISKTTKDLEEIDLGAYVDKILPPHGTKPRKINYKAPINEDFLKLAGYFVAEGSTQRAFVRFSLGNHEKEFAKEIQNIVERLFGLKTGIHTRKEGKSGIEVSVCHSMLANIFSNLFGRGAENKHIPYEFQNLPPKKQQVLLEAIFRGDGYTFQASKSKNKVCAITTISPTLIEQLRDLLLRLGYFPTERIEGKKVDKRGVSHRQAYTISWSDRARYNLTYEGKEGNLYWILPIRRIEKRSFRGPVYNLTVEGDHSYVARNFAVANCGVGGDAYRFLQEYEKIDFPQALKILADRANVKLKSFKGQRSLVEKEELYRANYLSCEFYHYLLTSHAVGKKALDYLRGRGITREAIEVFRLGYAPDRPDALALFLQKRGYKQDFLAKAGLVIGKQEKVFDRFRDRIIFPLHNHFGNVLGFAGRVLAAQGEMAKYINTPDTPIYKKGQLLYGLHLTKQDVKEAGFLVLVEGELDCISSWQASVRNVVAIKGSALTPEQAQLASRFCDQIKLATDSDEAGLEAARRAAEVAQKEGMLVKVITLGRYKDPDDAVRKDASFWKKAVEKAQEVYDFLIDQAFKKYDAGSTDGKARISRELTPVLASLDDEIVKAAAVKKLAEKLEVREEAVAAQVRKKTEPESTREAQAAPETRTRREILEEYFLSLAFLHNPKILSVNDVQGLFKSPATTRLVAQYQEWSKKKRSFDPSEFAASLPAELLSIFAGLILTETSYSEEPDGSSSEIDKVKKELEILNVREEMRQLGTKIRQLEQAKKTKKLVTFEKRLAHTGERLAKLELGIR